MKGCDGAEASLSNCSLSNSSFGAVRGGGFLGPGVGAAAGVDTGTGAGACGGGTGLLKVGAAGGVTRGMGLEETGTPTGGGTTFGGIGGTAETG